MSPEFTSFKLAYDDPTENPRQNLFVDTCVGFSRTKFAIPGGSDPLVVQEHIVFLGVGLRDVVNVFREWSAVVQASRCTICGFACFKMATAFSPRSLCPSVQFALLTFFSLGGNILRKSLGTLLAAKSSQ